MIFSANVLGIWFFPKKSRWNMIFLLLSVLSGMIIFLFPKNMILFFKRKYRTSHKNSWKLDIFCIFSKDGIFFNKKVKDDKKVYYVKYT